MTQEMDMTVQEVEEVAAPMLLDLLFWIRR